MSRISPARPPPLLAMLLSALALAAACANEPLAPTAAIAAPPRAHVGVRVQLDGSGSAPAANLSDPATVPLAYQWTLAAVPAGSAAALENPAGPAPRFLPDVAGAYRVQLVVRDFAHASAPAEVEIDAAADCVPTVSAASATPAAANVAQPVALTGAAAAPCNDPAMAVGADPVVSYRWSIAAAPAGSTAKISAPDRLQTSFVPDRRGAYDLVLQATDALGFQSAPAHVALAVNACGDNAPTIDSMAASPPAPGLLAPVSLLAQVSDSDLACGLARSLTYRWSIASAPRGSHAQLNDRAAQTPSFVPDVAGDYLLSLTVVDDLGRASAPKTLPLTASTCGGAAPVATATASAASLATGDAVQLLAVASDSDTACGLNITYRYEWRVEAAPLASQAQLNDAQLSNPSFVADQPGTYAFSVVVTASTGVSSSPALVAVQVGPCGSLAPDVTLAALSGAATGVPVSLTAAVNDPNTCKTVVPYLYRWSLKSAPPGSAARLSGADASGASAQASPSLVPDVAGAYTVQLSVTDALGLAAAPVTQTFVAGACNAPLSASIAAAGGVTGQPLQLQASGVSNPNASCAASSGPLAYAWSIVGQPAGSQARLNNAADAAPSFTPAVAGMYAVQLIVADAAGNQSPPATANLSVTNCSAPLSATIAQASGATGRPLSLAATVNDANDPALPGTACAAAVYPYSYRWSLAQLPPGSKAALNNARSVSPSFVPDVAGQYLAQVVVTDAAGNSSPPVQATVTVANCTAPLAATIVAPAGGATSVAVALAATLQDPNDPLTAGCPAPIAPDRYQWSITAAPPGSAAALNNPAAAAPSFTPDLPGTYVVALAVSDAAGNAGAAVSGPIAVVNCGAPLSPVVTWSGPQTTLSAIALSAAVADPNDTSACRGSVALTDSYAWSLTAVPQGSAAALDNAVAAAPRFTPDLPGTYVASARVTDALGNSGIASASIVVAGCGSSGGSALTARAAASTATPELGQLTKLSAVVSDSNSASCSSAATAPYSYSWTLAAPAGSKAVLAGATSPQASFTPDVAGSYSFAVTVTDALGYQARSASVSAVAADCSLTASIDPVPAAQPTFSTVGLLGHAASACAGVAFTWAWSFDQLPEGSRARFNNPSAQDPSFVLDQPNGTWVARLTLTDSRTGATASATRAVASNACGSILPAAAAGISLPFPIAVIFPQPSPAVGSTAQYLPGYQLQLDGTYSSDASAACTGPLSYAWSVYARPAGSAAQPYPASAAKPVFTPDVKGDYIFQLVVSDGQLQSAPSYLRINVSDPLQDAVAPVSRGVLWNDVEADPTSPTRNPSIAYYELNAAGTYYDLYFIRCTASCSSGSPTWTTPQVIEANAINVSNTMASAAQVSLKFLPGTGTPAVAYRYDASCQMHYALLNGSSWRISTIDALDPSCLAEHGEIQLMFVGAGNTPAVAYHTHSGVNPSARYAVCSGAGCTSPSAAAPSWTRQDVDTTGNAGHWMTAFVDPISKLPRLAYQDNVTFNLHYAACSGTCDLATGAWTTGLVEPVGTAGVTASGYWSSMALSPAGTPGIAFEDTANNQERVRLATCTANCADASKATWSIVTLAIPGGTSSNYFPSLQYDPQGQAHVTYIDSAAQSLRYAIQLGSTTSYQYFDIDHGVNDGHSSFVLTPAGSTHVSYALTTGLKYYPFGD